MSVVCMVLVNIIVFGGGIAFGLLACVFFSNIVKKG